MYHSNEFIIIATDIQMQAFVCMLTVCIFQCSYLYCLWLGRLNRKTKKGLEEQLALAQQTVRELEDKLTSIEENSAKITTKEIRIWMDGAFDMMHYGHMNAFRQGKALGTTLIVGVNSDVTIAACKGGTPVTNDRERQQMVRGCRWVSTSENSIASFEYLHS